MEKALEPVAAQMSLSFAECEVIDGHTLRAQYSVNALCAPSIVRPAGQTPCHFPQADGALGAPDVIEASPTSRYTGFDSSFECNCVSELSPKVDKGNN